MGHRVSQIGEQVKKELTDIIGRKIKDPRIGFVTITEVEMSGDLQQATVFLSVLGDETKKQETLVGLAKAKGFIRSEIGSRIRLRKVPEIFFEIDESIAYGSKIEHLITEIKKNEKST